MGNVVTAMAPAITMTTESTAAKIGRSIKNFDRADTSDLEQELMVREAASYYRQSNHVSDPPIAVACGLPLNELDLLISGLGGDFDAGANSLDSSHDDLFVGLQRPRFRFARCPDRHNLTHVTVKQSHFGIETNGLFVFVHDKEKPTSLIRAKSRLRSHHR